MKSDLDRLMAARELEAVVVPCEDAFSAPRDYLTGGVQITHGMVLKRRGDDPVIVAGPMEIEEAAKSGLTVYSFYDFDWAKMLEDAEGDRSKAQIAFWGQIFEKLEIPAGKIGVYGVGHFNGILELVKMLEDAHTDYQFVGETGITLFDEAFVTKDDAELARLRTLGAKTSAVLQATWDFIKSQRLESDGVVTADGQPVTIGMARRFVRRALLDHDLEDTGMIFAQGRDAGFPHSRGEDDMQLQAGQSIVFDLFPREFGGGYFHDVTRTWCIGHAPDAVRQTYDEVLEAFDRSIEMIRVGRPTKEVQEAVMTYFEEQGHATLRSQPDTTDGYVHSLGHGIGLDIHERPSISHLSKEVFEAGNVVTIEPGLYYPERGFGVRIEDSVCIGGDGSLETLTTFHKALVIPIEGA
jgi:Xaa-Pro aminopeptidase